jgi:sporulation protein YlmC with PRC-barrel domain
MKRFSTIVAASALALAFAVPVQGFAQSLYLGIYVAPDDSMSVKSMLGAPVYNDHKEKIGTIDTVMVKPTGEPMAVLSVGDYLGKGKKTVAVPLNHLKLQGHESMVMAGATKSMLDSLPMYNVGGG